MNEMFPNLASCEILVIHDAEGACYVLRGDVHEQLVKRGLWQRFCDEYVKLKEEPKYYRDRGHFLAYLADRVICDLFK